MTDEERLAAYAEDLAIQIEASLPAWVQQVVLARLGPTPTDALVVRARAAGQEAAEHLLGPLRKLLSQDIDQQSTTPLTIVRQAVPFATKALVEAGVAEVARDQEARRLHPDDVYDLTPGGYLDLGQEVQDASLYWGAAKAHVHIQRRKAEGV